MATIIDTAAGFPSPAALKTAGHSGQSLYLSPSRPGSNFAGKPATKASVDALRAAGLGFSLNWQFGKHGSSTPSDTDRGFNGGVVDAKAALATARGIGADDGSCPIYFSVDFDVTLDQWNTGVVNYFKGVNSVLGVARTGIYGHSRVLAWAAQDLVIGRVPNRPGKWWGWQTKAWSQGETSPEAVLYQRIIDTPAAPGPQVGGIVVDVNDTLCDDWGQFGFDRRVIQQPSTGLIPAWYRIVKDIRNNANSQSRQGARVAWAFLHTEEGGNPSKPPENLVSYCYSAEVSYHAAVGVGRLVQMVDPSRGAWAVQDANNQSYNVCFAGSHVTDSRAVWLDREGDIKVAAHHIVTVAKQLGYPVEVIARDYSRKRNGISDHYFVTQVLGVGTHTDVGPNFPWDVFAKYVVQFSTAPAPKPVVNIIDQYAADPKNAAKLGARITVGELVARGDKRGRYVKFQNGIVYWHPTTGAVFVSNDLLGEYGRYDYENGFLGFPTTEATRLPEGWVQAFERGTLYLKDDAKVGWYVHGAIGEKWRRLGWENSVVGWPISNEFKQQDGSIVQHFEHGDLWWSPDNTLVLRPVDGSDQTFPIQAT